MTAFSSEITYIAIDIGQFLIKLFGLFELYTENIDFKCNYC